jgi:hypothetical protein
MKYERNSESQPEKPLKTLVAASDASGAEIKCVAKHAAVASCTQIVPQDAINATAPFTWTHILP